jgi:four helix bundle protein
LVSGAGLARARRGQLPAQSTLAQATSKSRDRWGAMQLDHERLDVYDLGLEFLVLANGIIEGLPRGRSHLSDQFTRASLSIVLNLAEGAGKHSKLDKRRYYVTARGSATESAALLDVCQRLKLLDDAGHTAAKGMLVRIVSMLIKLAQSCEE